MNEQPDTTDPKPYRGLCEQPITGGEPAGWSPGAQDAIPPHVNQEPTEANGSLNGSLVPYRSHGVDARRFPCG